MRTLVKVSFLALVGLSAACSGGASDTANTGEDDLTSATARARKLTFSGYVYVDATASDSDMLDQVRTQTQTAFGALRTSEAAAAPRQLKGGDPKTLVKTKASTGGPAANAMT